MADEGQQDPEHECSICFEEVDQGTDARGLPCGHGPRESVHPMHQSHIDELIQRGSVCPICRGPLQAGDAGGDAGGGGGGDAGGGGGGGGDAGGGGGGDGGGAGGDAGGEDQWEEIDLND